jgi:serine/threonine protein kinase
LWDKICAKRRESWQSGQCVRAELILQRLPELRSDPDVIAEIAYQEFCLLEQQGKAPKADEFITRFPESAAALQRLFANHSVAPDNSSGNRDTIEIPAHGSTFPGVDLTGGDPDEQIIAEGKLFGRYLVVDRLGEGAMGVVYLGRDTMLNRPVALKFPRFSASDVKKGLRVRFFREARAAAAIDHPNICPIYEIGDIDGQDYIAMAYVAGPTLEEMIQQLGPMEVPEAFRLIRDVASALDECHLHGVVHRDLKPANIVVNQRGAPVIMDFGLAAVEDSARVTNDNQMLGTLRYMSPEQVTGQVDEVGPKSDIYGLGVTLYESVTAQPLFGGSFFMEVYDSIQSADRPAPSSVIEGLDPFVDKICLKALAKNPADRFASMGEFAEALTAFLDYQG